MESLSGCLAARLAEKGENYPLELIDELNRNVNPPQTVGTDDIYIRAMYIVSDQVNSQGGRFMEEEINQLTRLLIDSPVMVGHRRDSLPVARNFKAEKINIEGRIWVRSYFYWMKDSAGAEDLKNNIDGGIYKECSISFLFRLPECSICGRDIRECSHVPFNEYEDEGGNTAIAHFRYRQIEKVLETSLVFRGAIPDTRISKELDGKAHTVPDTVMSAALFTKLSETENDGKAIKVFGEARLHYIPSAEYITANHNSRWSVFPHQPGLIIKGIWREGKVGIETGYLLPPAFRDHLSSLLSGFKCNSMTADILLYACRGKQRQKAISLLNMIESGKNFHRLRIRICDVAEFDGAGYLHLDYERRIELLSEIPGLTDGEKFELPVIRKIERSCLIGKEGSAESDRYSFGLEVVEQSGKELTRHVIWPGVEEPVRLDDVKVSGGGRVRLNMNCYGKIPAKEKGLSSGAVEIAGGAYVLPGVDRGNIGKNKGSKRFIDILPGIGASNLVTAGRRKAADSLHIVTCDDHLVFCFEQDRCWHKVTVHHYSRHLLNKGRRFIASLECGDKAKIKPGPMATVALNNISSTGNLMHFSIAADEMHFGGVMELWLRPVLLDGRECYLFYAGGISRQSSEL